MKTVSILALRQRAGFYRRLAAFLLVGGLACLAGAIFCWMPPPASNHAFTHVAVPGGLSEFWAKRVGTLHNAGQSAVIYAGLLAMAGLVLLGIVLAVKRSFRWLIAIAALLWLINEGGQSMVRRGGLAYAELGEIPAVEMQRLTALASDPAREAQMIATGGVVARDITHNGVISGKDITPIDGKATHSLDLRLTFDPFEGPREGYVVLFRDGGPIDFFTYLHYCLAQNAYLKGDPAAVRDQLNRIDHRTTHVHHLNGFAIMDWRIAVMREWLAAKGMPVSQTSYKPLVGFGLLTIGVSRVLSWAAMALAVALLVMAGLLTGLAVVMHRRIGRIDQLWQPDIATGRAIS